MHFSCKISNAILTYLEAEGEDLSSLYDQMPWPVELLRDSTYWLSAPDMENFLHMVSRLPYTKAEQNVLTAAGHAGPRNHAWGVLDSVLKMMPQPQAVFQQPERFLSYFISPEPPVENVQRTENKISFDLPLPAEQYPHVTAYLKAAIESLPTYVGHEQAVCDWNHISLSISWSAKQVSIFDQDPGHQVSPDLLQKVVEELQKHARELEEKNRDLAQKNEELEKSRRNREVSVKPQGEFPRETSVSQHSFHQTEPGYVIAQNLARLHDYMVRAQQLVTVLSSLTANGKTPPAVKEVMRRVDWDFVKLQYPRTISDSVEHLRKLQSQMEHRKHKEVETYV